MISFKIQPAYGFTSAELRTLLLDLMLEKRIMMSTTIYPSTSHSKSYIRVFERALSTSLQQLTSLISESPDLAIQRLQSIGPTEIGFNRTQAL